MGAESPELCLGNGNITSDGQKTLAYNHLNKPNSITLPGGTITYTYAADGTKLQMISPEGTYDYIGGFFYKDDVLQHFSHEEGRVFNNAGEFRYEYNITDHLGNVRVSFTDLNTDGVIDTDPAVGEVLQEDHYYPFGLRLGGLSNTSGVANRYRYNGKELQDELGLNWYDYGARMYDPAVGRWNGVNPSAENYLAISPYDYVGGNPIIRIDPDGRDWEITSKTDDDGNLTLDITFKAAVLRTGNAFNVDMNAFRDAIVGQIQNAFTIDGENITTNVTADIQVIDNVEDLKDDQHLIEVIDENGQDAFGNKNPISDAKGSKGQTIWAASNTRAQVANYAGKISTGAYRTGVKHIYLNSRYANDVIDGSRVNLIPHEVGHTGGLYHPDLSNAPFKQRIYTAGGLYKPERMKNNLMISGRAQSKYVDQSSKYNSAAKKATELQIQIIHRNFNNNNRSEINIPIPYKR